MIYLYFTYIKKIYDFRFIFSLLIIPLNKFNYNNVILLVSFKKIKIYIIFIILLKKISIICYIMKIQKLLYNFNQNQNFLKLLFIIYMH